VRSTGVAYLLWYFTGYVGGHRFYLGQPHMGLLYFFTGGLCGVGWLLDAFLLPGMVEDCNEGIYAQHHSRNQTFFQNVRQDFRPQRRPSQAPNILLGIVAMLMAMCFMCLMCTGAVILLGLREVADEIRSGNVNVSQTSQKSNAGPEGSHEGPVDEGPAPLPPSRVKHPELESLRETHNKIVRVIQRKLMPTIKRLEADASNAKRELRLLRPKVKKSRKAASTAKKYLAELKDVRGLLDRMKSERDRYEQEAVSLQMAMRKLERHLEVADVLDDENKGNLKRLLARGEALVEEAEKGFDHEKDSLSKAVDDASPEADSKHDETLDELDRVLGGDDEDE
jgi:TM2 domain-containing membrane protein YozV